METSFRKKTGSVSTEQDPEGLGVDVNGTKGGLRQSEKGKQLKDRGSGDGR